jgi:glutamate--cysteine ligase
MVPHFVTSLTGPLLEVERKFLDASSNIERWFRMQWQEHTPPFYCSVDLRNAGYKLAPVDTNLYPGGFNNLSAEALPLAVQAAMSAIEKYCPDARNLLLIPENHTRNTFYLTNVLRLQGLLAQTGLTVRLGSLNPEVREPTTLDLPDGQTLTVEPLVRTGHRIGLSDFDPCAVLLNNDLSAGIPDVLKNLSEQILLPPLHAGWAVRRKTQHFAAFDEIASRFATLLDIDPWLVNPYFAGSRGIDFHAREGEDELAGQVDATLARIRAKYAEYRIDATPFVIVKADAGTYGMGIMSVKDASEVKNLNRKQRNKMAVVKEGLEVSEVIVQEGVPTIETVENGVAEPVVYMVDRFVVGGFYRVNAQRGRDENLNAPGAHFVPLPFAAPCNLPDASSNPDCPPNRFYAYGVVSRLALLAASLELEQTDPAIKG